MKEYMSLDQQDAMDRIRFLQREVTACEFHTEPCPLLMTQLTEADVMVRRLATAIRKARELFVEKSE